MSKEEIYKKDNQMVYLVLEYITRIGKKPKILFANFPNQKVLDIQTTKFDNEKQLAHLYYTWCKSNVLEHQNAYSIGQNTPLGKYLTSLLEDKRLKYGLKRTSFSDELVGEEYLQLKAQSTTNPIRLIKDKTEEDKIKEENIQMTIPQDESYRHIKRL